MTTTGGAWIYKRSGKTWTQEAKLVDRGRLAQATLSPDATTPIPGGPADNSNAGAGWVFTRSGKT